MCPFSSPCPACCVCNGRRHRYLSPPPPPGASLSSQHSGTCQSVPSHAGAWPLAHSMLQPLQPIAPLHSTRCRHLMQGTASSGYPGCVGMQPACCRHLLHPTCLSQYLRSLTAPLPADPSASMLASWWSQARPHSAPWERLRPAWTAATSQTAALPTRYGCVLGSMLWACLQPAHKHVNAQPEGCAETGT